MLVTVTNPIDNTEVEVELIVQLNISIIGETKTLNVFANGSKEI